MKRILIPIMMLLLVSPAYAQIISLGVSPSETTIDLYYQDYVFKKTFKFVNPNGDVDAIYRIEFEEELQANIDCSSGGICNNEEFIVPFGRGFDNPIIREIHFIGTGEEREIVTGFYIYGKPDEELGEDVINLQPRIFVRIYLNEYEETPTTTTTTTPTTTTTTQSSSSSSSSSSYIDFDLDLPDLMGDSEEDTEATVDSLDEAEETVITDESDGTIIDTQDDLTEKIKSEEGKLNFSEWIILPILGLAFGGLVVVYYLYTTKRLKKPVIPKWMPVIILTFLMIPSIAKADDISVMLEVTGGPYCGDGICQAVENVDNCWTDCAPIVERTLTKIGTGTGNMLSQMATPVTLFIILMGLASGISIIFKSIITRIGD